MKYLNKFWQSYSFYSRHIVSEDRVTYSKFPRMRISSLKWTVNCSIVIRLLSLVTCSYTYSYMQFPEIVACRVFKVVVLHSGGCYGNQGLA